MTEKKRARVDWDAVERDYRAGSFTLRELASKYGCSHQAIAKQAKAGGWTQDLTKAVRAATNARLIQEQVAKQVAASGQAVANAVISVAEANTQIILKHRRRLDRLNEDADKAREKLIELADGIANIREAAAYVSALEASARTTKIVIEAERKAFNLDEDQDGDGDKAGVTVNIVKFSDA
jgi:hypothetical protein